MKTIRFLTAALLLLVVLAGCDLRINGREVRLIEPSDTILSEDRSVSGFTGIEFSTFGRVILSQGEAESLTIQGSDNIIPLVETTVSGGILHIRMDEEVDITRMNNETILTFTITVKDLSRLDISGAGNVSMDRLETEALEVNMSGAGQFLLDELQAQSLDVSISGVGNVEISGTAQEARIEISGAGPFHSPDLKVTEAEIIISGLGSAELWVTDSLRGEISGAGNISYYGDPQLDTQTDGLGVFQALGNK